LPTLWIVIPVYNEQSTLDAALSRIISARLPETWAMRLVLVDDGSRDDSVEIARAFAAAHHAPPLLLHALPINRGKGAAVRAGFDLVLNSPDVTVDDAVIIQDADLEYDPADYQSLIAALLARHADAVYGSRFARTASSAPSGPRLHAWGNRILTRVSNLATGYQLSDMETCYKLLRISALRSIAPALNENRFGIEPQVTAQLARVGAAVVETPVAYSPRSTRQGKKIKWRDGVAALWVILREAFLAPPPPHRLKPQGTVDDVPPPRMSARAIVTQAAFFLAAVALLVWCVRRAVPEGGISALVDQARASDPAPLIGLLLCVCGSVFVNGLLFWVIARATAQVGFWPMQASNLIASILNYAPIRLGVLVRYLHHRRIDRVSYLTVTGWYATLAFVILIPIAAMAAVTVVYQHLDVQWYALCAVLILALTGTLILVSRRHWVERLLRGAHRSISHGWLFFFAIVLRLADISLFTARQGFAFRFCGLDLSPEDVLIVAIVKMTVGLMPVGSLGFADVAGMLAGDVTQGRTLAQAFDSGSAQAAQAVLLDRLAEMAVIIPLGIISLLWMRAAWRRTSRRM